MSTTAIGLIIVGVLLGLMALGVPVAFALGLTSLFAIAFFLDPEQMAFFGRFTFDSVNSFTLLAIPLFILMGSIFGRSKASVDLFDTAHMWLHRVRGALAMSSVVASALFAALSGSSAATAAAIGRVAIPQMRRHGYKTTIATGAVVAGGTLGILIPPSVTLILYGIAAEESIGQLFLGGVVPGIVLTLMFCAWVFIASLKAKDNPAADVEMPAGSDLTRQVLETEKTFWAERIKALIKIIPFILLIVLVLMSLYLGYATPSEAAAVGAVVALILVILTYRSLTLSKFVDMLLGATRESTMVMMIVAFSAVLGTVMSFLSIPQDLALAIDDLQVNRWVIMLVINLLLLVLGLFLPPVAIILMVTPVIYPIITELQFDPIWFGIIMSVNMEMGLITPPVGLNLYVVKGIAPDIPLRDILVGSFPYVIIIGFSIILFSIFPQLVLALPQALYGL